MRRALAPVALATVAAVALISGGPRSGFSPQTAAAGPVIFQCHRDSACPDITIAGDPLATIGGGASPFRGYGDPSLETDPDTGTIWMTYSWLSVLVSDPGPPPTIDFGVETHLARSDDGGQTFTFVRTVNGTQEIQHPDTGSDGWTTHEVSTLTKNAAGWEAMWLTYFDPVGSPPMQDFYYTRSLAVTPNGLGDYAEPWIDGYATSPSFGAMYNLSNLPELSDCAVFTEPALLTYGGVTYLATNCIVIADNVRRPDLERLVLLRQNANGSFSYVGALLNYQDAVDNGGDRIEQADLSIADNGAILLIATPLTDSPSTMHLGCKVFEVTDLATAQVRRDGNGKADVLMSIGGDDSTLGPGLCTYDAASATGVVIVLHDYTASPFDMLFSMRATGLHPEGLDSDGDGRADTADNCPSWPNQSQALPIWQVPTGDSDCDGYPDATTASSHAPESAIGTNDAAHCAATPTPNDEAGPDAWPLDFNDDQIANLSDVLRFSSVFGAIAPAPPFSPRFDFNGDGRITLSDVLQYSPVFNKRCA